MKKIVSALLGGLGLTIALWVLFPSAFLKDDTKWTRQNDLGRVDVTFTGDARDGQIDVQGKSLCVGRPQWMRDSKGNQGIMVQFPVSYLQKSYQITLTPRGNDKEMSLEINFRGKDLRVDNQRKPAYVRFENIRLNGKTVADERTVWHDKSFRYKIIQVSDNSDIVLSFDVRKPFSATDIRWRREIGLFMICSLFVFYFRDFTRFVNSVNRFNKNDIVQVIAENYKNIDVVYRRAFWIIFGVLCFAFGFHAIQFMWGNHDWPYLVSHLRRWIYFQYIGRYALSIFRKLALNGIYLPLIYDVVSFLFLALNAVLLCMYWRLEKRVAYFVLCGLILTAQPFTLSMMYYVHMLPETFIGVTLCFGALMISEKVAFEKSSRMKKVVLCLLSIVLINLSLAMYPVLINTIAVAFVGRLLVQSFEWDGSWKLFKSYFIPFAISVVNIVLGIILYKAMLSFVFPPQADGYNVQTLPFSQFPERLWTLFKQSFHQLYEYPFPFISQAVLWGFLSFTIFIALYICLTGGIKQKFVRLLLLVGAIFATQSAMMIAKNHIIDGRIELFGLVVFETLVTVLVFTNLQKMHNLSILAATGVVWVSIVNDLDCLRVWKLGFDAEKMLWNRVLARLERQKDFDTNRKYQIVQIGMPISLRSKFYGKSYSSTGFHDRAANLLSFSYDTVWNPFVAHEFFYPTYFRGERPRPDHPNDPKYRAQLKRLWEAGILDKAQAWPHENGLIVWKDVILFVTDAKLLEEYKKQLAKEFPRQPQNTP